VYLVERLNSPPVFSGVRVTRSLVLCVCFFYIVVCPFVPFLLAIVLSVILRYLDSDYPFGIFKLFLVLDGLVYGCQTPLVTIFQLYHCDQYHWSRKPEHLSQVIERLYNINLEITQNSNSIP
jgi:hypothetical protein